MKRGRDSVLFMKVV